MWDEIGWYISLFFPIGWYFIWFVYFVYSFITFLKESWKIRDKNLNDKSQKLAERMVGYKKKTLEEQDAIFAVLKIKTQVYRYIGITAIGGGLVSGTFFNVAQGYWDSTVWSLWLIIVFIASYFLGHFAKVVLDDFIYFYMIQAYRNRK